MPLVAKRYAQAFFNLSKERNVLEAVSHDLEVSHALLTDCPSLQDFLKNPVIPSQKQLEILETIFKGKIHLLTYHFILFLAHKGRLRFLKDICGYFKQLVFEEKGIVVVNVTTCFPLTSHQMQGIGKHLEDRLQKSVNLISVIDPGIIGGIKIQKNDTIYDYSLLAQLNKLKNNLIRA